MDRLMGFLLGTVYLKFQRFTLFCYTSELPSSLFRIQLGTPKTLVITDVLVHKRIETEP